MEFLRGDIFYVEYGKVTGSEQSGRRPAVIVSNDMGNKHSNMVTVVYLTSQDKKPLPTHCDVMCRVPSTAMCEQVYGVAKERMLEYIRSCSNEEMAAIDQALMISLGLEQNWGGCSNEEPEYTEDMEQQEETKAVASNCTDNEKIIRLETERDMYKQQADQYLNMLLER